MTSARCLPCVAAFVAAFACAQGAFAAGPTAQDYETARALYREGKDLRAAGNLRGALEKLKAAHELGHTPITGIELAHTQEQLGLLVEARETCLGVARMPVLPDESQRSGEARDEAAKLAESLKPRIASLRIHLVGVAAGATPIVTVDGENVAAVSLDGGRKVNPGHHEVTAHVEGGAAVSAGVDLAESQSREVTLVVPPPPAGYVPHRQGQGQAPATQVMPHTMSGLAVAGVVIGSVGLLAGVSTGIVAATKRSDLNTACPNKVCPSSQWQLVDSAKTVAAVSTAGFIIAGLGTVLFILGVVTGGSSQESPPRASAFSISPDVGLGYAGVHGGF